MEHLVIHLVAGAVGGNALAALARRLNLGLLGNSLAGLVGGGLGGQAAAVLGGGGTTAAAAMVAGALGGGVLMALAGALWNAMLR
jgi:hypothetical protein